LDRLDAQILPGEIQQADATASPLADDSSSCWFTDPPYYDAIPYSDLSDCFYVWLNRALPGHHLLRDPYDPSNPLTPKIREAVQDATKSVEGQPKDRAFFERTMASAFREGRRVTLDDGIGCVVFAHKTTEGWEALLSGLIQGGWVVTGSWPIVTEAANCLRARESAALATSVHLICRPRIEEKIGDWGQVLRELPGRVTDWMERLESEGVRGAGLVFACIGPAQEIFSRYSKVETAEGVEVGLSEYLMKVWEVVGRAVLEQVLGSAEAKVRNGAAGALEEDARLTALFLWTLQASNGKLAARKPDRRRTKTRKNPKAQAAKRRKGRS
jgi:adenine-specific DNA methylase